MFFFVAAMHKRRITVAGSSGSALDLTEDLVRNVALLGKAPCAVLIQLRGSREGWARGFFAAADESQVVETQASAD